MPCFEVMDVTAFICGWIGYPMPCMCIARESQACFTQELILTYCWASHTWNTLVLVYIVKFQLDFLKIISYLAVPLHNLIHLCTVASPILPRGKQRKRRHTLLSKVYTNIIYRAKVQSKYDISYCSKRYHVSSRTSVYLYS